MTPIEKYLKAYDHVLKIFQMNNDNYFKRTQILMIVIQTALFVAFGKVFAIKNSNVNDFLLLTRPIALIGLLLITAAGFGSALFWSSFIGRQRNVLDLCRSYLRAIENTLMQLGVPSGYWTYESMIAYPETYMDKPDDRLVMNFKIDPCSFPFRLETGEGCRFTKKHCDRFPKENKKKETEKCKIGLTRLERKLARVLCFIVWPALFVATLVCYFAFDC